MKQLSIILILATGILTAQAQTDKMEVSENTSMNAFHGEWRWVKGTDTVQLYLSTRKVQGEDRLVGWHFYKKGNITVQSSYPAIYDIKHLTLNATTEGKKRRALGIFIDMNKRNYTAARLSLNKSLDQIKLKLHDLKKVRTTDYGFSDEVYSIPENITLTKMIAD